MTESDFFRMLPVDSRTAARKVVEWIREVGGQSEWTPKEGYVHFVEHKGFRYPLFYLTIDGGLKFHLTRLFWRPRMKPSLYAPFDSEENRIELVRRYEEVSREKNPHKIKGIRKCDVDRLSDTTLFNRFRALIEWMTAKIHST